MQIKKIKISNFGKLSGFEMLPSKGLNVIYAPNEAGKTTLFSFIKYMLYGTKQKKITGDISFKEKYMPWNGMPMEGSMEFSADDVLYSLSRSDGTSNSRLSVFNVSSGTPVPDIKIPGEHFFSFGENAFDASCFVKNVLYSADKSGAGELMSYLFDSGSEDKMYCKVKKELEEKLLNLSSEKRKNALIPSIVSRVKDIQDEVFRVNAQLKNLNQKLEEFEKNKSDIQKLRQSTNELLNVGKKEEYKTLKMKEAEFLSEIKNLEQMLEQSKAVPQISKAAKYKLPAALSAFMLVACTLSSFFVKEALYFVPLFIVLNFVFLHKIIKNKEISKNDGEKTELIKNQLEYLATALEETQKKLADLNVDTLSDNSLYTKNFTNVNINDIIKQNESEIARLEAKNAGMYQASEDKKRCESELLLLQNEIERLGMQLEKAKDDASVIDTAINILDSSVDESRANLLPELRKITGSIFSILTKENQTELSFGSELGIFVNKNGTFRDFRSVSSGTADALYFSLRLALVEVLSQRGCRLPLFIDDSFANLDDERCAGILDIIYKVSQRHQVFLCTCRSREGEYFKNKDDVNIERMTANGK